MSFNFPNSPTVGQNVFNSLTGVNYTWDGSAWNSYKSVINSSELEYIGVVRTGSDQTISPNTDIIFNGIHVGQGNIFSTYNTSTGVFQLQAGKMYQLEAAIYFYAFSSTTTFIYYGWVDSSNVPLIGGSNGGTAVVNASYTTYNAGTSPRTSILYRPTSNISVKLRAVAMNTSTSVIMAQSSTYANIIQLR